MRHQATIISTVLLTTVLTLAQPAHSQNWFNLNGSGSLQCDRCDSPKTLFGWNSQPTVPADFDQIVTDRPDFTEASSTVGLGYSQFEVGYTFTFDDRNNERVKSHSLGEPLRRCGFLRNWLEFRIASAPIFETVDSNGNSDSEFGVADLSLGFKIGLTPQAGWLPEMALIPQISLPTGSDEFTEDETLPGVNWLYSWQLNDDWALGGSTQVNRAIDAATQNDFAEWAQSIAIGRSLGDRWGMYGEWFAFFPSGADTAEPLHFLNGGFTLLVNNNIQWDIRVGGGLNQPAEDFFAGTGLSIRFR